MYDRRLFFLFICLFTTILICYLYTGRESSSISEKTVYCKDGSEVIVTRITVNNKTDSRNFTGSENQAVLIESVVGKNGITALPPFILKETHIVVSHLVLNVVTMCFIVTKKLFIVTV